MARSAAGFTKAENLILDSRELTGQEKLCWIALRRFDFRQRGCHPSQDTLARIVGCSRRQVIRLLAGLEEKGLLQRIRDPGRPNWYRALLKPGDGK
jgi:DNA-binding MarR family transcriptional regulator